MKNQFRRVGKFCGSFHGVTCFEYPCTFGMGCCGHFRCRMKALRDAGHGQIADRLEANDKARDWLTNWGRMVYDPAQHGRDADRRKLAAKIIVKLRQGELSQVNAVIGGCWAGAMLPR